MIRLKEKAEPEAVDALTVCDELAPLRRARGGRRRGLRALAAAPSSRRSATSATTRASSRSTRCCAACSAPRARSRTRSLSHGGDARELIEQAEATLFQHRPRRRHAARCARSRTSSTTRSTSSRSSRATASALTGTPSGFNDLDELTGGFQPGNLIVLAARPSMGKSALVTNIAENAAVDHGKPVALFSLEMSETELAQRFIASQAKISGDELRKGRVKADRWPKVLKAAEKLAQAPLYVDDSSDIGILELRAKARRLHARRELGLVIVDYLQLMRPDGRTESRVEQIGQISRGLKILARELQVPVIAVSQLSRAVESRTRRCPMLSDLRESGQIEQDADVVMFIYRDEYYNRGVRAPRRGRHDHRQAPQRPHRRRHAHVPAAVPAASRTSTASGPQSYSSPRTARADVLRPGSERFDPAAQHDAVCPLGKCDGSGWLLDEDDDAARPCACRERRGQPGRQRAASGTGIPKRFRGVSFDRKPIVRPATRRSAARARAFVRDIEAQHRGGRRPVVPGRRRHGQDVPGDARVQGRARRRPLRGDLLGAAAALGDQGHLRPRLGRLLHAASSSASARSTCCTSTTSAPRSSTEWVLEQLYSIVNERWQDQRSIVVTTQPDRPRRAARAGGRAHRVAAQRDLRRPAPDHGTRPAHRLGPDGAPDAVHSKRVCLD